MKTTKKTRIPSFRHCSKRGFVCLNGRRHYLGAWGYPETQDAYGRTIAEWLSNKKSYQVTKDELSTAKLLKKPVSPVKNFTVIP
jgi:hypothetical protein